MNNMNSNLPVIIFMLGAIVFLLAPLQVISSFSANDLYITGLLLESIGVAMSLVSFCSDKINQISL
jgi:hypothetical protein